MKYAGHISRSNENKWNKIIMWNDSHWSGVEKKADQHRRGDRKWRKWLDFYDQGWHKIDPFGKN